MGEISDALSSPVWWLTTIVAGLIISIVGNILTQRILAWYRRTSHAYAQKRDTFIKNMMANPAALNLAVFRQESLHRISMFLLALGTNLVVLSGTLILIRPYLDKAPPAYFTWFPLLVTLIGACAATAGVWVGARRAEKEMLLTEVLLLLAEAEASGDIPDSPAEL